jgi:hypothetical protein
MNDLMTKEEIQKWIAGSKHVDTTDKSNDGCGSHFYRRIYERNGKLFAIPFHNQNLVEAFGENEGEYSVIDDRYEIEPVKKVVRNVTEYLPTDEHECHREPETNRSKSNALLTAVSGCGTSIERIGYMPKRDKELETMRRNNILKILEKTTYDETTDEKQDSNKVAQGN